MSHDKNQTKQSAKLTLGLHFSLRKKEVVPDELPEDKLINQFNEKYQQDLVRLTSRFPAAPKTERIKYWCGRIDMLVDKVKAIRKDTSIDSTEKETKIPRYLDVITDYQFSIRQALQYLQLRAARVDEIYSTTKQHTK